MGSSHSTRKITLLNDDKAGVIKLSESLAYRLRGQIEGQQAAAATESPSPTSPAPPSVDTIPLISEPSRVTQIAPEPLVPAPSLIPARPPAPEPQAADASGAAGITSDKLIPGSPVSEAKDATLTVELPQEAAPVEIQPDVGVAIRAGSGPTLSQPGGSIPPWSIYAEEAHLLVMRLREEKEQELQQLSREWREKMEAREQEFSKISQLSEEEVNSAIKEVEKLFVKASCTPVCQNHQEAVMTCYQDHPRQALRCSRQVEDFARCVDLSRLQSVLRQRAN